MAKTTTVLCDGCGADITSAIDDGDKYFCSMDCLDHWCARLKHEHALWRDFNESCVTERKGNCTTFRNIPQQERESKNAEIKAAALTAFPMHRSSNGASTE